MSHTVDWEMPVGCTDKGRHAWTRITTVSRGHRDDGTVTRSMRVTDWWIPPNPDALPDSGESRNSYNFQCPRCTLHIQVNRDRWWTGVRELVTGTEVVRIDLSLLPF